MNPTLRVLRRAAPARAAKALPLALVLWLGGGLTVGEGAVAAIHACTAADGTTVFQDRPCPRSSPAAAGARASLAGTPAGMHPSWFERPPGVAAIARCDDEGCSCGTSLRPYESGLALAVADALYLDGAWHRHEHSVANRAPGATTRASSPGERRRLVEEAACDVLMSQQTLRRHAERVFRELRARARDAENRGFDRPDACDAGDLDACAHHDDFVLYRRMAVDLGALRRPRASVSDGPAAAFSAADRSSR